MQRYVPRSVRQLRQLLKSMPIGMLTTQTGDGRATPGLCWCTTIDESGWLWFVTDRYSRKACELSQNPNATIAFQSTKGTATFPCKARRSSCATMSS